MADDPKPEEIKRGPGRPPGSGVSSKISAETLEAGCKTAVQISWYCAKLGARIFGGRLEPTELTAEELNNGTRAAMDLVKRANWLAILLMFVGFPFWLLSTAQAHFKREKPQLRAVKNDEAPSEGNVQS